MAKRKRTTAGLVALLKRRIRESGLTQQDFAEQLMVRDERTVRRWLGGSKIPDVARRWLEQPPGPKTAREDPP